MNNEIKQIHEYMFKNSVAIENLVWWVGVTPYQVHVTHDF
jgi:hypothetical protein